MRPVKVRVVGKWYALIYVPKGDDRLKHSPKDKNPGIARCDPDRQEIYVQDGLPLETEQDCVWHETKHIVEAAMGLDLPEEAINQMATGELAVMKENPRLLSYLKRRA